MNPSTSLHTSRDNSRLDAMLAWFFVLVWGSGYLASKVGMQYAPPFTFLSLRYIFGVLCLVPWVLIARPTWPANRREFFHVCIAGLLMHAMTLGGSHYAQYLGMSAGITALLLSTQPLITAIVAHRRMGERLVLRAAFISVKGAAGGFEPEGRIAALRRLHRRPV